MDENTIGRVAKGIEGNDPTKNMEHIEPTFRVEKVGKIIKDGKIEDVIKKQKENLHPFLGHNFDEKG